MAGIGESDVWRAADALLLEGGRPTIERVRNKLGRGSASTISAHLETWFKHLGARIKDPGAFSAPPDVPDPVTHVARHLWEVAQAQSRHDFDQRLQEGLQAAVANVEAAKDRARIAEAAAFDVSSKLAHAQAELEQLRSQLENSRLAAVTAEAGLRESRSLVDDLRSRLREAEVRQAAVRDAAQKEVAAAHERAAATERRSMLDMDAERTARAKVERIGEALQKRLDAAREAAANAAEQARREQDASRDREEALKAQIAAANAERTLERQRLAELRAANEASVADASAAREQVTSLQASLDRLADLVQAGARAATGATRRRSGKTTGPKHGAA